MNLADRLRAVVRPGDSAALATRFGTSTAAGATDALANRANADRAAEVLGGEWREVRARSAAEGPSGSTGVSGRLATRPRYLVIDRQYPTGHRLGRVAVSDCLPVTDGLWPRANLLMSGDRGPAALPGRLLFFDLETTGLGGGAGTYAFLVGCGWFEGTTFRVRQFFLSSYAAERALLEDVADTMGTFGALVTYNGKSFDLPLIDTRFLFHRLSASYSGLPHLDMLHIARRLWRSASATQSSMGAGERLATVPCRLTHIEQTVLGHVRNGDVPGFEIPSRYFQYVRTGDTRPLESVLEHNRLDLLALAMLTATASQLLETGAGGARTAREALGLGQLFERAGMLAEACACYTRAAGADPAVAPYIDVDSPTCAEAWRAYGVLCRRERRYEQAAEAWRRVLALPHCPTQIAQQASEALAVHHEHRVRDLSAARCFAIQALTLTASTTRVRAVNHRLARIDRKLGVPSSSPEPLF
jgi:uncharacterized protein YprB with RNaseH-like and TPR domain